VLISRQQLTVLLSALALVAAEWAGPAAAQTVAPTPITINFGYASRSSIYWHMYVAEKKGFYAEAGIDFKPVFVSSGYPGVAQGILARAFQLGSLSADVAVPAIQNGADLIYVGSEMHVQPISMIVQPTIKSFADIRGNKKVGSNSLRGGTAMLLRLIFKGQGIKEGTDYDMIVAGSSNDRLAGLRNKQLDVAMVGQPQDFQMQEMGFNSLGQASDWIKEFGFVEVWAKRDWAKGNEEAIVRFLRANARTIDWLYDPANKEEAIKILAAATKTEDKYSRLTYEMLIEQKKSFTPKGEPSERAIDETIRILAEAGELKPGAPAVTGASITDKSFWQKAVQPR
jgi:ABC-type nitrate/sulfonate/bicarbonate transport system substrate-binding protein